MSELNRVHSAFDTIEALEKDKLEMIGRTIGYGRAIQILGQLWDDMLQREYPNVGRHQEGLHRRTDIERIEAGLPIARQVTYFQKRGRKGRITALVPFDYTIENVASIVTDTPLYGRAPVSTPQQSAQRASVDTEDAFAWAVFADNGNVIIWSKRRDVVEPVAAQYGKPVVPIIAHINAWGSAGSGAIPDLYTCKGKGGKYAFLGVAKGAGNAKLIINLAVYRDVASGQLYFRDPTEFDSRMEKIAAPSPAPQGELA